VCAKGIRVARRSCRPSALAVTVVRPPNGARDGRIAPRARARGGSAGPAPFSARPRVAPENWVAPQGAGSGARRHGAPGQVSFSTCRRPRVSCALRDTRSGSSVFEKLGCRRRLNAFQRTGRQVSVRSEPQTGRLPAVSVDADAAVERSSGEARSSGVARTRRRRSRARRLASEAASRTTQALWLDP
jgi:hypothetical protein